MLYPVVELELEALGEEGRYTLPSGNLGVFPFTLSPGGATVMKMHMLIADMNNMPQDHSMRGWISNQKGGNPVVDNPASAASWTLSPLNNEVVVIYDMMGVAPDVEGISLGLLPGNYWLNVLNLVNEQNSFAVEITGV